MNIAVYCGSAPGSDPKYLEDAQKLGEYIGKNGHTLVYGGSNTGLMGAVADSAMKNGAKTIGVLPNVRLIHERKHPSIDEYYHMETMSQRKDKMIELSDAYIALPGGYGTLDEISDILCLNRIGVMNKPTVFVNTNGYYNDLKAFFKTMTSSGFVGSEEMDCLLFSESVKEIMEFIEKW